MKEPRNGQHVSIKRQHASKAQISHTIITLGQIIVKPRRAAETFRKAAFIIDAVALERQRG